MKQEEVRRACPIRLLSLEREFQVIVSCVIVERAHAISVFIIIAEQASGIQPC